MRMTGIGHVEATFSSDNRVTGEVPSLSSVVYSKGPTRSVVADLLR